jgi:hypothetical protein
VRAAGVHPESNQKENDDPKWRATIQWLYYIMTKVQQLFHLQKKTAFQQPFGFNRSKELTRLPNQILLYLCG